MSATLQRPPPYELTIPEFLEWSATAEGRWQLRDGEAESMNPPTESHGAIQACFAALLFNHLVASGRPCRVISNPAVIPRLRSERNMLVPELAVTCAPPANGAAVTEPVLLVEILSPSNWRQTRANVWAYTTIPSVTELLVVHSLKIAAELLRRQADGSWPAAPEPIGPENVLRLASVGFEASLRALYATSVLA